MAYFQNTSASHRSLNIGDLPFAETHGDQGGSAERSVSCNFEEGNGRLARLCKLSRDLATLGLCTAACHDEQIGQVWSPCGTALAWGGVYEARNNDTRVGTLWKSCWATEPKPPKPFDGACGWGPNLATRKLQPSKATLESQGPALSQTISPSVLKKKKIIKLPRPPALNWLDGASPHVLRTKTLSLVVGQRNTFSVVALSVWSSEARGLSPSSCFSCSLFAVPPPRGPLTALNHCYLVGPTQGESVS